MLEKMWRNENSAHCGWHCKIVQLGCKTIWQRFRKLKLSHDLAILLLCIHPREMKTCAQQILLHKCLQQHNSQQPKLETIRMSINWQMDRYNVAWPWKGTVFSNKSKQITDICYVIDRHHHHLRCKKLDTRDHISYNYISNAPKRKICSDRN